MPSEQVTIGGMPFTVVSRSEEVHRCGKRTYCTVLRNPQAEITVTSEGMDYPQWLKVEETSEQLPV